MGSDRRRHGVDLDTLPDVLVPAEVARLFRVDAKTVTRWANAGQIECFHTPGGHRRFTRAEVARLLEAGAS